MISFAGVCVLSGFAFPSGLVSQSEISTWPKMTMAHRIKRLRKPGLLRIDIFTKQMLKQPECFGEIKDLLSIQATNEIKNLKVGYYSVQVHL